jgi:hypothetical protein
LDRNTSQRTIESGGKIFFFIQPNLSNIGLMSWHGKHFEIDGDRETEIVPSVFLADEAQFVAAELTFFQNDD